MASTEIAFYIYYLLIISPGSQVYVQYLGFAKFLQENYLNNLLQDIPIWDHQALKPLSGAHFEWCPGHVPYLSYPIRHWNSKGNIISSGLKRLIQRMLFIVLLFYLALRLKHLYLPPYMIKCIHNYIKRQEELSFHTDSQQTCSWC